MENKTGKYIKYAIGEIFLVMIGILLALQVSNWNQQRIAENKEKILLSELHQEFVENKIQFDIVVGKHQLALDACKWIGNQFPIDIEEVAMDSLKWKRIDMKKRWTFNPSQGVITSLVNTSSFELISDRELRRLLISWNDVLVDYQEDELCSKQFVVEQLNPFFNTHFNYRNDLDDPRFDLSAYESGEFENMVRQRAEYLIDILGIDLEFSKMQTTIDRIIELSASEGK